MAQTTLSLGGVAVRVRWKATHAGTCPGVPSQHSSPRGTAWRLAVAEKSVGLTTTGLVPPSIDDGAAVAARQCSDSSGSCGACIMVICAPSVLHGRCPGQAGEPFAVARASLTDPGVRSRP